MADDFRREAVTSVEKVTGVLHPLPMPRSGHPLVNLTVPHIELAEPRQEVRQLHELAHLFLSPAGRGLLDLIGGRNRQAESGNQSESSDRNPNGILRIHAKPAFA
jgi:hypothetical protein